MAYNEELDLRIKKIVSRWKGTNDKKFAKTLPAK